MSERARTAWAERPTAHWDAAARRAHFRHGPIDLQLSADGPEAAVRAALSAAWERFQPILSALSAELPALRAPAGRPESDFACPAARRMAAATAPHAEHAFVTPMAAVAGAVADEILAAMLDSAPGLTRAAVNNGGDIAVWLSPGARFSAALAGPDGAGLGVAELSAETLPGLGGRAGLATSGWRGRSFSLGVADSVTVLAASAAAADVAATLIANAVDLPGHPGVSRAPAEALAPDSDLGARLVTQDVGPLSLADRAAALEAGAAAAARMAAHGRIAAAALFLQGETRSVGPDVGRIGGAFKQGKAA